MRSPVIVVGFFLFAQRELYLLWQLKQRYGFGTPLIICTSLGVASGLALGYAAQKLWRMPRRISVPWAAAIVIAVLVVAQVLFAKWGYVGRAYSLAIMVVVGLAVCFRALMLPRSAVPV